MRVLLPCARALEDLLWGICFNYKIGCGRKALFKQSPFQIRRSAWRHQRGRVRAISGTACRSDVDSCLGRLGCRLEGNSHWIGAHHIFLVKGCEKTFFFLTDSSVSSNKRNTDNIKLEIKVINRVSQKGLSLVSRIEPESSGNG